MPLTDDELDDIERRCAAASPAPWKSYVEGRDHTSGSNFIMASDCDIELMGATIADQDFIAHAREDVPRLLAEVRRLRPLGGSRVELQSVDALNALVARLRQRPGMYFGNTRTITMLGLYLDGAGHVLDVASERHDAAHALRRFSQWLARKAVAEVGHYTAALRILCAGDEERAFDQFFVEWDAHQASVGAGTV